MKVRHCVQCSKKQPYDPSAKPNTASSMFKGDVCWACYKAQLRVLHKQAIVAGQTPKELAYQRHLAELAQIKR